MQVTIGVMNTPAHMIINMAALGRGHTVAAQVAVLVGSVAPDAPMFWFYFVEKVVRGTPEREIWRDAYFRDSWQSFIDLFNSVPVIVVGLLLCWWLSSRVGLLFFLSMLLHVLLDLPFHNDDAHRHFYPLSDWRFESPLSYWDPRYHGNLVGVAEIAISVLCMAVVFAYGKTSFSRWSVGLIFAAYAGFYAFAMVMWSGL